MAGIKFSEIRVSKKIEDLLTKFLKKHFELSEIGIEGPDSRTNRAVFIEKSEERFLTEDGFIEPDMSDKSLKKIIIDACNSKEVNSYSSKISDK